MKNLHILVGGSGFIAHHLRLELARLGKRVLILDKKKPRGLRSSESHVVCDIRQGLPDGIAENVNHDTVVHHLAAVHFDFQSDFYETNVTGTVNVINALSGCENWIFYSSVATYGDSLEKRDENSPQNPTNDYGKSKLQMESVISQCLEDGVLKGKVVVVRPGVVYGEWNFGNVFNLMWISARYAAVGLRTNPIKSMAYVKNLVESTLFALEKSVSGQRLVYNYVDYEQLGTMDLLRLIASAKGRSPIFVPFGIVYSVAKIVNTPFALVGKDFLINPMRVAKFAQPTHFVAEKIRTLGFRQSISPEDGITRTINWIKDNNVKALREEWLSSFKD